jgi:hypothetical protein
MKERFLLDRIALHTTHVAPRHIESAAPVVANLANARLAVRDWTAMAASKAAHPAAVELFIKLALTNVFPEDFSQGRHGSGLI